MNNCLFCERSKIEEDILWESDNFYVKVGVGILAPGHIMLISKEHLSCFGELPTKLDKEFLSMLNDIFNKLKSNFSEPIIYEHGIYSQTVPHAHIHFVPRKSKYYDLKNLKEKIFKELKSTQINNIFQIKDVYKKEGSYFYLEEKDSRWIFHTKGLPESKYCFRKEFAKLTGLYGLSAWRNMPEEEKKRNREWVRLTKERLKTL